MPVFVLKCQVKVLSTHCGWSTVSLFHHIRGSSAGMLGVPADFKAARSAQATKSGRNPCPLRVTS